MESVSSEQDKLIASVVLAGWRIVDRMEGVEGVFGTRWGVYSPDGQFMGARGTRYAAALAAEAWLWGDRNDVA